ncbi:OmpA family protein [Comamonas antarctica]|uniref:Peptidoglycan-associated lipoprotein n=1 Tax=Comamonas antarctica TaxID=2743470 RepID=A0A6N1X2D3_9BURK|nr:OmpA family protein [Comamonas antarctica]QKV53447.1 OmpA family protein [Comamonas antarctica]
MKHHHIHTTLLLACFLAACSSTPGSSSQRSEQHYAFGKPPAPMPAPISDNARVAPVVAQPQQGRKGPENVAHIVYFDFDSYAVKASDRAILESHARWLRDHPQRSLVLQGHTDSRGGIEYNLALGHKRAQAVRSDLQLLGVPQERMEAVSYGKEQLADPGTSESAHQRNRRVEFEYR